MTFRLMLADNKLGKDWPSHKQLEAIDSYGHFKVGMLASYKMDGIRATAINGTLVSRSLTPIRSAFAQRHFGASHGYDGELICGDPVDSNVFQLTDSAVMTIGDERPLVWYLFDDWSASGGFLERSNMVRSIVEASMDLSKHCRWLEQFYVDSPDKAAVLEEQAVGLGYEGLILRRIDGPYKCNRSTLKEGWMLKLKRFQSAEARVIGFEERMHNANEAKTDARGFTKRSSSQGAKVGMGTLGALKVVGIGDWFPGVHFNLGVFKGFSHEDLQKIWNNREQYLNRIATYEFQNVSVVEAPRQPRLKGFRSPEDMS